MVLIHSHPTQNREFQRNSKKIKKTSLWPLFKQNVTGKAENERNKIIISIHSNPTRNTEFQRMSKKIQKTRKHHYGFFSSQNGT